MGPRPGRAPQRRVVATTAAHDGGGHPHSAHVVRLGRKQQRQVAPQPKAQARAAGTRVRCHGERDPHGIPAERAGGRPRREQVSIRPLGDPSRRGLPARCRLVPARAPPNAATRPCRSARVPVSPHSPAQPSPAPGSATSPTVAFFHCTPASMGWRSFRTHRTRAHARTHVLLLRPPPSPLPQSRQLEQRE